MTDGPPTPPTPPPGASSPPQLLLSPGEFLWLTIGVWLGGIFILAVLPRIFIPRFGMAMGVAASYFVFFLAWQPVQAITQRVLGVRAALLRMILFVGSAAVLAFYLRELLNVPIP